MSESASVELDRTIFDCVVQAHDNGVAQLAIPGSEYVLHLAIDEPIAASIGDTVVGRARASARRIDVIASGGGYIEPMAGRPRRVQGRVIAVDEVNNAITVLGPIPVVCALNSLQKAIQFKPNEMASFDVAPGMSFEPVA